MVDDQPDVLNVTIELFRIMGYDVLSAGLSCESHNGPSTCKGDTLVVWKLDQLARSMKQLIETIESFQDQGIGLKSLQDPIDTSSPSGKLVFHIFAAPAEFERGVIRERTSAGLRAARECGRVRGRPPALSAKDLQLVRTMLKDSDITVASVARRLNLAPSTLYRHILHARSANLKEETSA